jgi:outer membrane protein assembly factor BamB
VYDGGPAPIQSAGDHLFVVVKGTKGVQLLMIDPQTGQTVQKIQSWENFAFYDFQGRPYLIANSQAVYLTGAVEKETRQVIAFDRVTGKPLFNLSQDRGGKIWCDDVNLYVMQGGSRVNVYDAVTGQLRWTYDPYQAGIKFINYLAGLSSSGNLGLVIANGDGDLDRSSESWIIALDAQNGHVQWSKPYASFLGSTIYPPVDTKGPILMIGGTGRRGGVMALSPADGSEQWHFVTQGIDNNEYYSPMVLSPASDGAHTFVISYVPRLSGLLTQINPDWH